MIRLFALMSSMSQSVRLLRFTFANKGYPDEQDLERARAFAKGLNRVIFSGEGVRHSLGVPQTSRQKI